MLYCPQRVTHTAPVTATGHAIMRNVVLGLLAITLGAVAGLLLGWYVWPVTLTDVAPDRLRADWQDEAIWMAAQAYAYDRDLEAALARLQPLGHPDLGGVVRDRAERALSQNWPAVQVSYLARLAAALGSRSPQLEPFLTP